mmetsp:Transcript_24540/g.38620  ORF Transcript_24540/g.38620 Transcript_24540/m.38620 type:complete len:346 (-) Transcript_24540:131-1168(-)
MLDSGNRDCKTNSGEDVSVVSLAWDELPAVVRDRCEGAATGEQHLAVSVFDSLLGSTLGARCGVGESKDDGPLVDRSHELADVLVEDPTLSGHPDDTSGLQSLHCLAQSLVLCSFMGIRDLVVLQGGASSGSDQSLRVYQPATFSGLLLGESLGNHLIHNQICNACTSFSSTHEDKEFILQCCSLDATSGHQSRKSDGGSTLDIVIERTDLVAISVEQAEGIAVAKVLELNEEPWVLVVQGHNQFINELIVLLALHPRIRGSSIEGIVDETLGIGSDVDRDGQAASRGDARAGGVEVELANRDAHSISAKVTESQDSLTIRHYNHLDVLVRPIVQQFPDASLVLQ